MSKLDITKLTVDLSGVWAGFLRDWDRTLRAANHPQTTRYNYLIAAAQLGRYLAEHSPDPDAEEAADDPCAVTRAHVESFQAWMIGTRSASTALNKHKCLQQFFKFLLGEQEITRSPMERVPQPKTPRKLIPVIRDEDTRSLLDSLKGKGFAGLRDEAIIRLLANTGARLSEVGTLHVDDVDLATESVRYRGKGAKDRRVRFGPKTARALSRYLRARAKHTGAHLPHLWLADRGGRRLEPNGIKIRLKRLGATAGDTGDLMLLLGWTSEDMPRHYGASAAAERAQQTHRSRDPSLPRGNKRAAQESGPTETATWAGISELGGLPLVFGALPALLRSLPEADRLPRRDEAGTIASPSGL